MECSAVDYPTATNAFETIAIPAKKMKTTFGTRPTMLTTEDWMSEASDEERAVFQAVASSVKNWELDNWEILAVASANSTIVVKSPSGRVYAIMVDDVSDDQ